MAGLFSFPGKPDTTIAWGLPQCCQLKIHDVIIRYSHAYTFRVCSHE
jgi:hypothetical protein